MNIAVHMNDGTSGTVGPVIFLHGLGDTPSVWEPVAGGLDAGEWKAPALVYGSGWSVASAADRIAAEIDAPAHIVGLSLGAVIALETAVRYPEHVRSLYVSAPQSRPPRTLMRLQKIILTALPSSVACPPGMTRGELRQVLDAVASINLDQQLPLISAPTTVACGAKDFPNRRAARKIADLIPDADLEIIPGAGHRWHETKPDAFAARLANHLAGKGRSSAD